MRRRNLSARHWIFIGVLWLVCLSCSPGGQQYADFVLLNGKIVTVDENDTTAEALAGTAEN